MRMRLLLLLLIALPLTAQTVDNDEQRQIDSLLTELQETQVRLDSLVRTNNPIDLGERITKAYEDGAEHGKKLLNIITILLPIVSIILAFLGALGIWQGSRGNVRAAETAARAESLAKRVEEETQKRLTEVKELHDKLEAEAKKRLEEVEKLQEKLKEETRQRLEEIQKVGKKVDRISHTSRAYSYLAKKEYEEALKYFEKAIAEDPENDDAWFQKGYCLGKLERAKEAIKAFDEAISLKPADYDAHYNRGVALSKLGSHKEAIKAYNKAIELKPYSINPYIGKGNSLFELRLYAEAISAYDEVIRQKPDTAKAYNAKAGSFLVWGAILKGDEAIRKFELAEKNAQKAVKYSNGKKGFYNLACSQVRLGEFEEALVSLKKSKEVGDDYPGATHAWQDKDLEPLRKDKWRNRFIEIVGSPPGEAKSKATKKKK